MKQEDIEKAAAEYANNRCVSQYPILMLKQHVKESFIDGAKWALMNQWISVHDRLPKDGETVFALDVNTTDAYVAWYDEKTRQFHDTDGHLIVPTHWMEMP